MGCWWVWSLHYFSFFYPAARNSMPEKAACSPSKCLISRLLNIKLWSHKRPKAKKMMIMDTYPKVCRAPMHGRGSILLLCLLPPSSTKFSEIEKNVSIFCTQLGDFIILKVFHWIELYIFHSLSFMVHAEMSENTFSSLTSKFSRAIACLRSTKFNYNFLPKSFKPNLAIFLKRVGH